MRNDSWGKPMRQALFWCLITIIYLLWPITLYRDSMWGQGITLNWYLPLKLFAVLAPLWFISIIALRKRLSPKELHFIYLPIVTWVASFFLIKCASWMLFKGNPAFWSYGRDKGLSNFILAEPPLVCMLIAVAISASIYITKKQNDISSTKRKLLWASIAASFLVALLTPPLPD